MQHIAIINGPNLNMLGKREPTIYGTTTLEEIYEQLKTHFEKQARFTFFQSNHEGQIIDHIQSFFGEKNLGIIANLAALTHTSIAIRDALLAVAQPVVEVHLSNLTKRDEFRQCSYLSDIAIGVISGFGWYSYVLGVYAMLHHLQKR